MVFTNRYVGVGRIQTLQCGSLELDVTALSPTYTAATALEEIKFSHELTFVVADSFTEITIQLSPNWKKYLNERLYFDNRT